MIDLNNISAALRTAYISMNMGLPTAYPNRPFTPPASAPWAKLSILWGEHSPSSMGGGGQNSTSGILQVDIFIPEHDGSSNLLGYAGEVLNYFKAGQVFTYSGQAVKILRGELSPISPDEARASHVISVSIYWDSRSTR